MRNKEIPASLVPVALMLAAVRDRARKVRETGDLGALSLEMALLVVALIAFTVIVIAAITAAVTAHSGNIK